MNLLITSNICDVKILCCDWTFRYLVLTGQSSFSFVRCWNQEIRENMIRQQKFDYICLKLLRKNIYFPTSSEMIVSDYLKTATTKIQYKSVFFSRFSDNLNIIATYTMRGYKC